MRKLVLSIIAIIAITPAMAEEMECTGQLPEPSDALIQEVAEAHPGFDEGQVISMATMYDLAYSQHQLANNEALPAQERAFAERTHHLALRVAAIQLHSFEAFPQMATVLERM